MKYRFSSDKDENLKKIMNMKEKNKLKTRSNGNSNIYLRS